MSASTVYEVRLKYLLEDRTTKGLKKMDRQLARTSSSATGLGRHFKRLAAGAGAFFGIRAGVKHLIGFNANMEQARIQMAGMIQLTTKGSTEEAISKANKLVDVLQQKAKASVGTTKDMVDMASLITRPVLASGVGMKKLADFTAQAVVASRAFGIESGMAARDIEAALMGQLRSVDRFSRALLEPLGFVGEEGREAFNALGAAARATKLEEALGGPAIVAMAKAQENSFSGVMSTFKDTLQITLGTVGKPLFQAITTEIKTWNEWITKNGDRLADMSKRFGSGLVSGFRTIKSVIGFMVDHADLLLTVAKVWATVKLGQQLGGMAETMGAMAGRMTRRAGGAAMAMGMDRAGLGLAKFGTNLESAGRKLAGLATGVALAVVAVKAFETWMNQDRESKLRKTASEKVEALQLVAGYDPAKAGITGLRARERGGGENIIEKMEDLARMQAERAETGAKMTSQEVGLAQELKDTLPERQAFWKNMSGLAQEVGATRAGEQMSLGRKSRFMEGFSMQDFFAQEMRRALGGKIGTDDVARKTSELALYQGLGALRDQLGESADRQADFTKMITGTFVEGPMAQALLDLANLTGGKNGKKPDFNVTIQRIEVQSDNPARFVVGLTETVRDAVRNRSAAYDTLVEGR